MDGILLEREKNENDPFESRVYNPINLHKQMSVDYDADKAYCTENTSEEVGTLECINNVANLSIYQEKFENDNENLDKMANSLESNLDYSIGQHGSQIVANSVLTNKTSDDETNHLAMQTEVEMSHTRNINAIHSTQTEIEIENDQQLKPNASDESLNEDIANDDYYARKTKISFIEDDTLSNFDSTDDVGNMNSISESNDIGTIEKEPERKKLGQEDSSIDMIGYSTLGKHNHSILRRTSDEECKSHKLYEIDQKIFFESKSLPNTENKGTDLTPQTNISDDIEEDKLGAVTYPTST